MDIDQTRVFPEPAQSETLVIKIKNLRMPGCRNYPFSYMECGRSRTEGWLHRVFDIVGKLGLPVDRISKSGDRIILQDYLAKAVNFRRDIEDLRMFSLHL